ncbi:hypothetical protein F5141DRAFT_1066356 [Pisolithus sp. B1]|nr:hypothetical protein F5141DRAFT_1066356 [Pisolithus sp. B1]
MSFATSTIHTAVYNDLLAVYCSTPIHSVFAGIAGVLALRSTLRTGRTELKTTSLRGPSGAYPMFGASKDLFEALDIGEIFETSAKEYARHPVRERNAAVTRRRSQETKADWDPLIGLGGGESAVIEIQAWINHILRADDTVAFVEVYAFSNLHTIGTAGFFHEFGSLSGKPTTIQQVFSAFDFAEVLPVFSYIPVSCIQSLTDMQATLSGVTKKLLGRMEKEKKNRVIDGKDDKFIVGSKLLVEGGQHVTPDEVLSLVNFVRVAIDDISEARGTRTQLPLAHINRPTAIWGSDAKVIHPECWLEKDGGAVSASEEFRIRDAGWSQYTN